MMVNQFQKYIVIFLVGLGVFSQMEAQLLPNIGGQRAGISALSFLKIDVSPRSAALGGAMIAGTGDGYATYWNPAASSEIENTSITVSNTFMPAGINHSFLSVTLPHKKGHRFSFVTRALNAGAMEKRTEYQPLGTGEYVYAYNLAVGFSYALALTESFSFGASAYYVNETLAEYKAHTVAIDLGFLYKLDVKDLKFAVALKNFGPNSRLSGPGKVEDYMTSDIDIESFPAATVFQLGVSMIPWKTEDHSLTTSLQLNHPNDNAENIRLGVEYQFKKLLSLRAGYQINVKDQPYPTFGFGINTHAGKHPVAIDFSTNPTKYLGWYHRFGINFQINNASRDEE